MELVPSWQSSRDRCQIHTRGGCKRLYTIWIILTKCGLCSKLPSETTAWVASSGLIQTFFLEFISSSWRTLSVQGPENGSVQLDLQGTTPLSCMLYLRSPICLLKPGLMKTTCSSLCASLLSKTPDRFKKETCAKLSNFMGGGWGCSPYPESL